MIIMIIYILFLNREKGKEKREGTEKGGYVVVIDRLLDSRVDMMHGGVILFCE